MMNLDFRPRINTLLVKLIFIAAFFTGVMYEAKSQTASDTPKLDQPIFGKVEEQPDAFITWGHSVQSVSVGNKPYFLAFHLYSALAIIMILMFLFLLWKSKT